MHKRIKKFDKANFVLNTKIFNGPNMFRFYTQCIPIFFEKKERKHEHEPMFLKLVRFGGYTHTKKWKQDLLHTKHTHKGTSRTIKALSQSIWGFATSI